MTWSDLTGIDMQPMAQHGPRAVGAVMPAVSDQQPASSPTGIWYATGAMPRQPRNSPTIVRTLPSGPVGLAQDDSDGPALGPLEHPRFDASTQGPDQWLFCIGSDAAAESVAQSFRNDGFIVGECFGNPQDFTRWLVAQPRGDVSPWGVLVTHWRDAKPCAMAIQAARTGDVSNLRLDAGRSRLVPVSGTSGGGGRKVNVAIKTMYILSQDRMDLRHPEWAMTRGMMDLDIRVVGDLENLRIELRTGQLHPARVGVRIMRACAHQFRGNYRE